MLVRVPDDDASNQEWHFFVKAKCLNGSPGEELLEEMFLKNENLREKYRGTCDNDCQKKREDVIKQLEDAGDEMDKTIFRDELVIVISPFLS